MSKVRPKRAPRLSFDSLQPVIFETTVPIDPQDSADSQASSNLDLTCSSSVSSLYVPSVESNSSPDYFTTKFDNMFPHVPYNSDSGFGIMNPMFDGTGESPELPSPIKPTIVTSQSMPTMSTSITGLLSPPVISSNNYSTSSSTGSVKVLPSPSNDIFTPPNTPFSNGTSIIGSPWSSRSGSNLVSPALTTPPNTPFSNPPSPDKQAPMDQSIHNHINSLNQQKSIHNPAMAERGQLYNILGYPVDLPNTKPIPVVGIQISPKDHESKVYPFSSYPNPHILDSFTENEKVIKHLVKLGNGVYNEKQDNCAKRKDTPSYLQSDETVKEINDLVNLDDKDQCIKSSWNHNLDMPRINDQHQKIEQSSDESNQRESKDRNSESDRTNSKEIQNKKRLKSVKLNCDDEGKQAIDGQSFKTDSDEKKDKRSSLFEDSQFPMIDDDNSCPGDPPTTPVVNDTSSSSLDLSLLGDEVEELAEQLCEITNEAGRLITEELKEGIEYLTQPEDTLEFTWVDALTVIISIGLFYFDVISDCNVAYNMYYDRDAQSWFTITVIFIVIPLVLANAFSLYWYWFDERVCEPQGTCYKHPKVPKSIWALRVISHILLQASVIRQLDILYYGTKSTAETVMEEAVVDEVMQDAKEESSKEIQEQMDSISPQEIIRRRNSEIKGMQKCSRRTAGVCAKGGYVALWIHSERDAANVDMFLSLIQDAPQLILQFYIMALTLPGQVEQGEFSKTLIWQICKEGVSFLSLAWSVTSFVRAIRLIEVSMTNLSLLDLFWLTLTHLCSIAGQVMSFALFASKLVVPFLAVSGTHWLVMSTWVLVQLWCFPRTTCTRAVFAHDKTSGPCNKLDDVIYSSITGIIFLFTFVDVGGISPRTQFLLYHTLTLIEEGILLTIWFLLVHGWAWYHWVPLILVPLLFGLTLLFDSLFCAYTRPVVCVPLNTTPSMAPKSV